MKLQILYFSTTNEMDFGAPLWHFAENLVEK